MCALCFHVGIHGHEGKGSAHAPAPGLCFRVVQLRTLLTHKDRCPMSFCISNLNYDHAGWDSYHFAFRSNIQTDITLFLLKQSLCCALAVILAIKSQIQFKNCVFCWSLAYTVHSVKPCKNCWSAVFSTHILRPAPEWFEFWSDYLHFPWFQNFNLSASFDCLCGEQTI